METNNLNSGYFCLPFNEYRALVRDFSDTKAQNEKLRLSIEEAINILGGPVMTYAPTISNEERAKYIEKASYVLIKTLKK